MLLRDCPMRRRSKRGGNLWPKRHLLRKGDEGRVAYRILGKEKKQCLQLLLVCCLGSFCLGLEFSWDALLAKGVFFRFVSRLLSDEPSRHLGHEIQYCIKYQIQTKPSRYRILVTSRKTKSKEYIYPCHSSPLALATFSCRSGERLGLDHREAMQEGHISMLAT